MDDIVQDVMSSVSNAIRTFEYDATKGRFRSWFGTVAANRIKTFIGKQVRANEKVRANESSARSVTQSKSSNYVDPDTDWINIFSERVFRTACERIKQDFAEVTWASFEATWVRNESASDVAKSLGIPVHSIYVNKSRVLKRLEAEIRMLADDMPISQSDSS